MHRLTSTLLSAAVATLLFASAPAAADDPVMTILQPKGIVYLASFPAVVPVRFQVNHDPINTLNALKVVSGIDTVLGDVGNPFGQQNQPAQCTHVNNDGAFNYCSIDSPTQATVGLNWTVPSPGTYLLTVEIKDRGYDGEGTETVQFVTLTAEYPAPPAVANAYLNSGSKLPKGNVRGCIISAIAELHAKDSYYGPKGGPYNNDLIRSDVDEFRRDCGG